MKCTDCDDKEAEYFHGLDGKKWTNKALCDQCWQRHVSQSVKMQDVSSKHRRAPKRLWPKYTRDRGACFVDADLYTEF